MSAFKLTQFGNKKAINHRKGTALILILILVSSLAPPPSDGGVGLGVARLTAQPLAPRPARVNRHITAHLLKQITDKNIREGEQISVLLVTAELPCFCVSTDYGEPLRADHCTPLKYTHQAQGIATP